MPEISNYRRHQYEPIIHYTNKTDNSCLVSISYEKLKLLNYSGDVLKLITALLTPWIIFSSLEPNIYASFTPEAYQPNIIRFELLLHTVQVTVGTSMYSQCD